MVCRFRREFRVDPLAAFIGLERNQNFAFRGRYRSVKDDPRR